MKNITGTLIWYYYICERECWLMAHQINPHQENSLLELGRLIHEESYAREKKEFGTTEIAETTEKSGFMTVGMKIDVIGKKDGKLVIGEVKKSDRFLKSATMQLSFYLYQLREISLEAKGELLIPKSKKRISVELTDERSKEIELAISEILNLIKESSPPTPVKIPFCKKCAYNEFCWV